MIFGVLSGIKAFMTSQTNSGKTELKVLSRQQHQSLSEKKAATALTFIYQVNSLTKFVAANRIKCKNGS
ncbi:hypothetical protein IQ31_04685 [Sphingobacterium siyangense]|uniref:Uncharacterized protein n=1 Tax=Sphingobacterium siyangense TaxID=459529 RepID=A0A562M8X3_9SPHI|nr:hypothetical protein IQ31_04685 [Sphingobacterium siyangense]